MNATSYAALFTAITAELPKGLTLRKLSDAYARVSELDRYGERNGSSFCESCDALLGARSSREVSALVPFVVQGYRKLVRPNKEVLAWERECAREEAIERAYEKAWFEREEREFWKEVCGF